VPLITNAGGRRVVYLTVTVYPCTTASACSAGAGQVRLQSKIGINDIYVDRDVVVYSWGLQR
jgi:hypothetical protein